MALQILNSPGQTEDIAKEMKAAIEETLPGAEVAVRAVSSGHFEVDVVSETFEGLSQVKRQQRVYGAIGSFMSGPTAPVHAIDRMVTRTP